MMVSDLFRRQRRDVVSGVEFQPQPRVAEGWQFNMARTVIGLERQMSPLCGRIGAGGWRNHSVADSAGRSNWQSIRTRPCSRIERSFGPSTVCTATLFA